MIVELGKVTEETKQIHFPPGDLDDFVYRPYP
jgi:hypothetical protein